MTTKVIWKFPVPPGTRFTVLMPRGAKVLCVQVQHGEPQIWASVDNEAETVEAREFHLSWASSVIDQCSGTGTKVFVKQLGSKPVDGKGRPVALRDSKGGNWDEWSPDLRVREMLDDQESEERLI